MEQVQYSIHDFLCDLRTGKYTSLGGYPLFFATSDGAELCPCCARKEVWLIGRAIRDNDTRSGWHVFGSAVNWEDPEMHCGHCYERIESAYAEPEGGMSRKVKIHAKSAVHPSGLVCGSNVRSAGTDKPAEVTCKTCLRNLFAKSAR